MQNENVGTFIQKLRISERQKQSIKPSVGSFEAWVPCDCTGPVPMKPALNTGDCTPQFLCQSLVNELEVVEEMCAIFEVKHWRALCDLSSFLYHSKHGVLLLSGRSHQIEAVPTLRRAILKSHLGQESTCVLSHWDMGAVCYCSIGLAYPY